MVVSKDVVILKKSEELGMHCFPKRSISYIDVRIRRERTRFGAAVGINVEESSSCCRHIKGNIIDSSIRVVHIPVP